MLLSVTPIDGEWAVLSHFRVLRCGRDATAARYLMTGVLADELAALGVRYLCDSVSPLRLKRGVLHFSRMVGFRTVRLRVRSGGRRDVGLAQPL